MEVENKQRYRGALLGLAVGDALGVPAEFKPRGCFPKVTEIEGGGVFHLTPGEWTDDTTMALCMAQSLIEKDGFDPRDQMDKYWQWIEKGYMSSNGRMFDIGDTTSDSLCKYRKTGQPYAGEDDPRKAGNGSLMRTVPIPLFFRKEVDCIHNTANASATTHGAKECIASCVYFTNLIRKALNGLTKEEILSSEDKDRWFSKLAVQVHLNIAGGGYKSKPENLIKSTGYVIHTLEAALWCFYRSNSFEEGAIMAVNLGDDADTTGAVFGQIAGAFYGVDNIPKRWIDKTVKTDIILNLADKLYEMRKE